MEITLFDKIFAHGVLIGIMLFFCLILAVGISEAIKINKEVKEKKQNS